MEKDFFLPHNLDFFFKDSKFQEHNAKYKVYSTEGTCWSALQRQCRDKTRSAGCLATKGVRKTSGRALGPTKGPCEGLRPATKVPREVWMTDPWSSSRAIRKALGQV